MFVYEQVGIDRRGPPRLPLRMPRRRPQSKTPESTGNLYSRTLTALGVKSRNERIIVSVTLAAFFGVFAYFPTRELVTWYVKTSKAKAEQRQEFENSLSSLESVMSEIEREGPEGMSYERFHDLYSQYTIALNETQRAWGELKMPDSMQVLFAIHMKLDEVDDAWKKVMFHDDDSRKGQAGKALLQLTLFHEANQLVELINQFDSAKALKE